MSRIKRGKLDIAIAEGKSEEDACEEAETDVTMFDNGHYILSWEWHVSENPSREEVLAAVGDK